MFSTTTILPAMLGLLCFIGMSADAQEPDNWRTNRRSEHNPTGNRDRNDNPQYSRGEDTQIGGRSDRGGDHFDRGRNTQQSTIAEEDHYFNRTRYIDRERETFDRRQAPRRGDRRWDSRERSYEVHEPERERECKKVIININHDCLDSQRPGQGHYIHKIVVRPKAEGHAVHVDKHRTDRRGNFPYGRQPQQFPQYTQPQQHLGNPFYHS